MAKLVWRVKLITELEPGIVSGMEMARIERDGIVRLAAAVALWQPLVMTTSFDPYRRFYPHTGHAFLFQYAGDLTGEVLKFLKDGE
jgi:hypothetical protein